MDLKRLHYFCTIAEQGQVSRAAKVLHMAQPPLSQRLLELEAELGGALFVRQGRSLVLTEAGKLLYARAREILRAVEATRDEVVRISSQVGPSLRIGLSPTCRSFWRARFQTLRTQLGDRQLGIVVGDSSYLEYLLQAGQLDVALMMPPLHPENFTVQPIATSNTVAVASPDLLPPSMQALSLAELGRHPLFLLRRSVGVGSYERLLQAFHEAGLNPDIALYSSDVDLLLDLLAQGVAGIAVVPETETGNVGAHCRVLPIEVALPSYFLSLVYRRADSDEPLMQRVLAALSAAPA